MLGYIRMFSAFFTFLNRMGSFNSKRKEILIIFIQQLEQLKGIKNNKKKGPANHCSVKS